MIDGVCVRAGQQIEEPHEVELATKSTAARIYFESSDAPPDLAPMWAALDPATVVVECVFSIGADCPDGQARTLVHAFVTGERVDFAPREEFECEAG